MGAEVRAVLAPVIALYQQPGGYFWRGQLCCGRCTGSAGAWQGRGGLISRFSGKRLHSRASRAAIPSPWALVSLVAGPGRATP